MIDALKIWIRRLVKILKWGVIVIAVLLVIDGALARLLAGRNQALIDRFLEGINAENYSRFVGGGSSEGFSRNGWYLYLGALSTLSPELIEMGTIPDERKRQRDLELDLVHDLLLEAERFPFAAAITPNGNTPELVLPPMRHVLQYAKIALVSGRDRFDSGDRAGGAERLLDVMRMRRAVSGTPIIITTLCSLSVLDSFIEAAAPRAGDLPDAQLQSCIERLEALNLKEELTTGFRGELFYIMDRWNELLGGMNVDVLPVIPLDFRLGQAYLELDRNHTLEFWVPLALEPTVEKSRELEEQIPFYAFITRVSHMNFEHYFSTVERHRVRKIVLLEGLRMEQGRRRTGTWPRLREEVDGIPLEMKETAEGVEITSPRLQEWAEQQEPLVVELKGTDN